MTKELRIVFLRQAGLASMRPGGVRVLRVPAELGFGAAGTALPIATCDGVFCDKSAPPPPRVVPGGAELTYEVELIKVVKTPAQMSR